jgi:hypothetical protein
MPCYSRVETKLKDVPALQAAAAAAGMTLEVNSKTLVTLVHGSTRLQFQRLNETMPFVCYAEYDKQKAMLNAVTSRYAEARVKAFAKKRGYMVSQGAKPGEFVLTSYR